MKLTRRATLAGVASSAVALSAGTARAMKPYKPSDALLEAARKEGEFNLYSATFPEVQSEVIRLFNKTYPFIRVNYVRASGGMLFTRIQSEAASGNLDADVIEHSDRGQIKTLEHLFTDYAPPNAAEYDPATLVSPKLWPTTASAWCIAWNSELVKDPPRTWMDLCDPRHDPGTIAQVIAASGGTTWTRVMFERQVLGEDYWARQAATKPKLFPSGAPLSDAVVRGELMIAPLLTSVVLPKKKEGAPIDGIFPPEGIPISTSAAGISRTARHPNAARLWLDWVLSDEGQAQSVRDQGNMTGLKVSPVPIEGFDPKVHKVWVPEFDPFQSLHDKWVEEWNKTYGYRQ